LATAEIPPSIRGAVVKYEAIHGFEQDARKFGHLLGGRSQFRGAGSGLLHQFAHLFHGPDHGL
jgi:hypothetical protein